MKNMKNQIFWWWNYVYSKTFFFIIVRNNHEMYKCMHTFYYTTKSLIVYTIGTYQYIIILKKLKFVCLNFTNFCYTNMSECWMSACKTKIPNIFNGGQFIYLHQKQKQNVCSKFSKIRAYLEIRQHSLYR